MRTPSGPWLSSSQDTEALVGAPARGWCGGALDHQVGLEHDVADLLAVEPLLDHLERELGRAAAHVHARLITRLWTLLVEPGTPTPRASGGSERSPRRARSPTPL